MVDIHAPEFRFEERVQRLVHKGLTREEAEIAVTTVIMTKENHVGETDHTQGIQRPAEAGEGRSATSDAP